MKDKNYFREKLLAPGKQQNMEDILGKMPPAPCYLGPGRWIRALRELYSKKTGRE